MIESSQITEQIEHLDDKGASYQAVMAEAEEVVRSLLKDEIAKQFTVHVERLNWDGEAVLLEMTLTPKTGNPLTTKPFSGEYVCEGVACP